MRREHLSGGTRGTGAMVTGTRSNALWGKGRRRYPLLLALAVVGVSIVAGVATTSSTAAARRPGARAEGAQGQGEGEPQRHVLRHHPDVRPEPGRRHPSAVDKAQKQKPGKAKGVKKKFELDRDRLGRPDRRPGRCACMRIQG